MVDVPITIACGNYDRCRPIKDGRVKVEGCAATYLPLYPEEIFFRAFRYQEFDVSELSLSNYVSLVDSGSCPFIAIPVFPSKVFRHGYFFVDPARVKAPSDLVGKRAGVPEYSMTAAVYMRGLLQHEFGVLPNQLEWVQGRADRLGRALPPDIKITHRPGSELGDLLESGEIDVILTANAPAAFRRGSSKVTRLFPNYKELEKDYYRRTHIYPIMHTVVIRREVYDRDPWAATSLYQAFCTAKARSMHLLEDTGSAKASLAWLGAAIEEEREVFGPDWWSYGVEANRPSIEALLQYSHEQGLTDRKLNVEELFAPSTLRDIPVSDGQLV